MLVQYFTFYIDINYTKVAVGPFQNPEVNVTSCTGVVPKVQVCAFTRLLLLNVGCLDVWQ
jgi:hypothetical protein